LNLKEKNEMNVIRKQNDELALKFKSLTRENETLKAENVANMAQINELNDQVRSFNFLIVESIIWFMNLIFFLILKGHCHVGLCAND